MGYVVRSPRQPSSLHAVLVKGSVHTAGVVRDLSTTGLFIEAPAQLALGERVAVVPVLDDLEGVRLVAEVVRTMGRDGLALRLLGNLLPDAHKSRTPTWMRSAPLDLLPPDAPSLLLADPGADDVLAAPPITRPGLDTARYVVRPRDLAGLRDFEEWHLGASGTMLFAHDLRAPGDAVVVVVMHPITGAAFELDAVVVNTHEHPHRRLDVHFLSADVRVRARFHTFVETGVETGAVGAVHALPPASRDFDVFETPMTPAPIDLAPLPYVPRPRVMELEAENALLRDENERLRGRVDELQEVLDETERAERALFARVHELERSAK